MGNIIFGFPLLSSADGLVLFIAAYVLACLQICVFIVDGWLSRVCHCFLNEWRYFSVFDIALHLFPFVLDGSIDEIGVLNILLLQILRYL